jgi:hypothetical protein
VEPSAPLGEVVVVRLVQLLIGAYGNEYCFCIPPRLGRPFHCCRKLQPHSFVVSRSTFPNLGGEFLRTIAVLFLEIVVFCCLARTSLC